MESNSIPADRNDGDGARSSSVFQKTVCLNGWWLIKAEADSSGKRLAVGGITSREKELVRTFSSAPIVKRYDVFTLETADGLCVVLNGFVNKKHTSENGFPEEVFKHFVFGFPQNWEHYAVNCFESEFCIAAVSENIAMLATPLKIERPDSCRLSTEKPLGGPVNTKHTSDTKIPASLKKTKRKLHFSTLETPRTQREKGANNIISPDSLSYGRSRSGRVLVPTLEFWRNQMPVYDADRRLTGIRDSISTSGSCTGTQSLPRKKPKRQITVAKRTKG